MKDNQKDVAIEDVSFDAIIPFLKDYYVSILAFLLVIISFFLVFLPQFREIFDIQNKLVRQNRELETYVSKLSLLTSLSEAELNSQIGVMEIALPSQKPAFSTLEVLQGVSKRFEMTVTNFEFSPGLLATESASLKKRSNSAHKISNLDSIFVDLNMEGEYDNLLAFVDYLENSLPLMDVASMSFSSESEDGIIASTLSLIVYFSPPPEKIGKISDPLDILTTDHEGVYEEIVTLPKVNTQTVPYSNSELRSNPFDY